MAFISNMKSKFGSYSPQYWVVISLELFERGAYYGIMGWFPVHAIHNLGFSGTVFGAMYALLVALLYFVPIVAASLARKIGYRKILLSAFIVMIPTYFAMTFLRSDFAFFYAIVAWGIGAGAFKPMVSSTIAHVTEKEHRNSAYSIYYLAINWGSLLAMLAVGFLIPQHFAQIVFLVAGVLITVNLVITFFLYKDPVEKNPAEKISDAFIKMGSVLADKKFTILLILYSGFFILFSSMHTFIPAYYVGFGIQPVSWLTAPVIAAINPLTIVTLGPFLAKTSDKFPSLKLMITGMFIFTFGIFILGAIPLWYAMAMGIFIYSIGEFLTHPNFISYVSKIAPEEKVALYMGYAFLPMAVGNVLGSLLGGVMWDVVAVGSEMSGLFWVIYVCIGIFTIGGFLIYNRLLGPKPEGEVKLKRGFFNSKWSFAGVWAIIPILILVGTSLGTTSYIGVPEDEIEYSWSENSRTINLDQNLAEGETLSLDEYINETYVIFVNISLTWEDEPDETGILPFRQLENRPDRFSIDYEPINKTPVSDQGSNPQGQIGTITLTVEYSVDREKGDSPFNGTGHHYIDITLENAGDQVPRIGPGIIAGQVDNSNELSLQIVITYLIKTEIVHESSAGAGH